MANRHTMPHTRNDLITAGITKNGERYVVLCDAANVGEAYRVVGKWAAEPSLSLTWHDAARLGTQIARESLR